MGNVGKNQRVAFWVVVIGVGCGAFLGLAAFFSTTHELLSKLSRAYTAFPNETPPFLASQMNLPAELAAVADVALWAGMGATLFMGLFLTLLLRTKEVSAGIITGGAAGLLAGVASFALYMGWALVLALSVAESLGDIHLLADAAALAAEETTPAQAAGAIDDPILKNYPDLGTVAATERPGKLMGKIVADIAAGAQIGIWLGMGWVLLLTVAGAIQSSSAVFAIRRGDSFLAVLANYLELSIVVLVAVCAAAVCLIGPVVGALDLEGFLASLALVGAGVLAFVGVKRGWEEVLRLGLYGVCLIPLMRMNSTSGWLLLAVIGPSCVVLGWYLRRRRLARERLLAAGDAACPKCGHDLRGQEMPRCPECGHKVSTSMLRRSP